MKKAIVLFSGGLDSTTCLAYAKSKNYECIALSFNYSQKHSSELNAAKKIAAHYQTKHIIIDLPIHQFGQSALTDQQMDVPDHQESPLIPVTYVPARNTIFLAFALGWAETFHARDIFMGVSHIDYSGYPDCRPEYIQAFQKMANLAVKMSTEEGHAIHIHTPIIQLSKAQTIQLGLKLGVNYQMTVSCYKANTEGHACGKCSSCAFRKKGFLEAGIADPTIYYLT